MKRRMVHFFSTGLAALALTLGAAGTAFAGPATDVVKGKQTALFDLIKQSTPAGEKKIAALFEEMLDYPGLAEGSLGTSGPRAATRRRPSSPACSSSSSPRPTSAT